MKIIRPRTPARATPGLPKVKAYVTQDGDQLTELAIAIDEQRQAMGLQRFNAAQRRAVKDRWKIELFYKFAGAYGRLFRRRQDLAQKFGVTEEMIKELLTRHALLSQTQKEAVGIVQGTSDGILLINGGLAGINQQVQDAVNAAAGAPSATPGQRIAIPALFADPASMKDDRTQHATTTNRDKKKQKAPVIKKIGQVQAAQKRAAALNSQRPALQKALAAKGRSSGG